MPTKFYPPITDIVPVDKLPNELGFVKTGLTAILSKIYYRNLQLSTSSRGDSAFYSLEIVSLDRIDIEIPGTGVFLVLNPSHSTTGPDETSFPITLAYEWPILGYLRNFDLAGFSFQPGDFFDLALAILNVSEREMIDRVLAIFIDSPTPITTFVDDVNSQFGTSIAYPTGADPVGEVLADIDSAAGVDNAGAAIFAIYIIDAVGDGQADARLKLFFNSFFGGDIKSYIRTLITPKINATISTSVGIEFPRNILTPLQSLGGPPVTDPNIKTMLRFNAGDLYFSTDRGIGFDEELVVTLDPIYNQIGNTGLGISLDYAKLDLSRTENIPEADADGRPADFVGVYIREATISFPAAWNEDPASTGVVFGRDMIIGTGGFSGTLGLEAKSSGTPSPLVKIKFGDNFQISLDRFSVTLKQNSFVRSEIMGTLRLPGFKDANDNPADIRVKVNIHDDGDFDLTAFEEDGFKEIKFGDVFAIQVNSFYAGKQDGDFYVGVSGCIRFLNGAIAGVLKGDICVEKLLIWSDGRIEIEGGSIPLPEGTEINVGPAKIAITALHFGSHQQEHDGQLRKYRYFGFDGGLSLDPGGVDARGEGIKFYFTVDNDSGAVPPRNFHAFLQIQSISLELVIPGNVSRDQATAIIKGYLAIKGVGSDKEYEGGIEFSLPKANIAGGASMKYKPSDPSWIVDAFVELAAPIPLGATGMGIYGFRGLLGHRYVASRDVTGSDTWFEYYKAPPQEGVGVSKFKTPDQTDTDSNPFSVGAGISLATAPDNGKAFSTKLFLLLSIPEVFYLEGKANILGERVGLTGDDPPFFAYLAISPSSIETGFGADYKVPDSGLILKLYAEVQAGFFFDDPKAWYINFGTEAKPITARILSLFNAYAFLMLSASGIRAEAGVNWGFDKNYAGGMVRASVEVYIIVGGRISFERPQVGGYAMVGGHVDVYLLFLGFHIGIDTSLSVEAPKPFIVQGSVRLCVGVTIGFWKFKKRIEKCFNVEFIWKKDPNKDTTPVIPFNSAAILEKPPLKGLSMQSGEHFDLHYFGTSVPNGNSPAFNNVVVPLDTWIDIEFKKGMVPTDVNAKIGGFANVYENTEDLVPPDPNVTQVVHQYSIKAIDVKAWDGSSWVTYHPYAAMTPPTALPSGATPASYYYGHWQLQDKTHNKIRLLSETPFSYMQQGQPGWYVPEQFGITSATLFCETTIRDRQCVTWMQVQPGVVYQAGQIHQQNGILFRFIDREGTVANFAGPYNITRSVCFENEGRMEIILGEPCAEVELKLTTYALNARITFYRRVRIAGQEIYTLEETRTLSQAQLLAPVMYVDPAKPIGKVVIEPAHPDPNQIYQLQLQLLQLYQQLYDSREPSRTLLEQIAELESQLEQLESGACNTKGFESGQAENFNEELKQAIERCRAKLDELQRQKKALVSVLDDLQAQREVLFAAAPGKISYEIYQELDDDGIDEYRFRLRYSDSGDIFLSSSTCYRSISSAEKEMFMALEHALSPKGFQMKVTKDKRHYFNIADASGEVIARRIEYWKSEAERNREAEMVTAILREVYVDGGFIIRPYAPQEKECPVSPQEVKPIQAYVTNLINAVEELASGQDLTEEEIQVYRKLLDDLRSRQSAFAAAAKLSCRERMALYTDLYTRVSSLLSFWEARCKELEEAIAELEQECKALSAQLPALENAMEWINEGSGTESQEELPCVTYVHEICCLSLRDHTFNITLPGQAALEASYQASADAIEKMLRPIWRPDTKYYVRLQVRDRVDNAVNHDYDYYFGFRTHGPIGYFHNESPTYLPSGADPAQFALTSLRTYIDYQRSYPNADGNLIQAKPIFYEDARLLLFFVKEYTYHFFNDWPAYNGLSALTGARLQIVVKDPSEDISLENPPPIGSTSTEVPEAIESWPSDNDPRIPEDIRALLQIRNPELVNPAFAGGHCWTSGGLMIRPASVYVDVAVQHLKPLKLYTAVFNNRFRNTSEEVHRYVFQTSRYPDFTAQVNSFLLQDSEGNTKEAIFQETFDLSTAEVDLAYDILTGNLTAANLALAPAYAQPFDRIIEGAWKLIPLDAPVSTEFNVIRQNSTGNVIAIWIRNPEPFNDPKIPTTDLDRSLKVMTSGSPDNNYDVLFSKDGSQVIVMNTAKNITATSLIFRFIYLEWDGREYVDQETVVTSPIDLSI
ncbi:MAG: hypothetical protein AAF998_09030 [Bacteroidota bacterium]